MLATLRYHRSKKSGSPGPEPWLVSRIARFTSSTQQSRAWGTQACRPAGGRGVGGEIDKRAGYRMGSKAGALPNLGLCVSAQQ